MHRDLCACQVLEFHKPQHQLPVARDPNAMEVAGVCVWADCRLPVFRRCRYAPTESA